MDNQTSTRRLLLQSAGVASTIIIAGCSGNGDETDISNGEDGEETSDGEDGEETSDEDDREETSDGEDGEETSDEEDEEETSDGENTSDEESLFANYSIDNTELSVELTEDALGRVAQIRLETPSEEKTTEVAETITEYSIDILRDRAGTWLIDAMDSNEEVTETVELETTFSVSVDEIGTLAQLGVTGESPDFEEVNYQLTITNNGTVPVEPSKIQMVVPDLDYRVGTIGTSGTIYPFEDGTYGGVVDRDGEVVISSGSDNTYRSSLGNAASTLLIFEEDRANEIAGQSFQGEVVIEYQAEREDTVVPISIEMGDEVITEPLRYLQGTTISKR